MIYKIVLFLLLLPSLAYGWPPTDDDAGGSAHGNGANCAAGNAPLGVDANGAVESCYDVWTEAENTAAGYGADEVGTLTNGDLCTNDGTDVQCTVNTEAELETALDGLDVVTITASDISKANLETALSDVSDIAEADGDTYSGTHDFSGATVQLPALGNGATSAGFIRLLEDSDNGTSYLDLLGVAALAGNISLTLPNDDGGILQTEDSTATFTNKTWNGVSIADAYIDNTITVSNYLPLAAGAGSPLTGELYTDNLGINYVDSDTNPTCGAGEYKIYADTSETILKKCQNGVATDLDTTAAGSGDAVTVNAGAVDTTAEFTDNLYTDYTLTDGGAGGPDVVTVKPNYGITLAGNPALAVDECVIGADTSGGFVLCEGSTADTNEQLYRFPDANGADTTEYIVTSPTVDGAIVDSIVWNSGGTSSDGTQCADPAEVTINSGPILYSTICADNDASSIYGNVVMPDSWDGGTVTMESAYIQTAADTAVLNGDIACQCRGATEVPSSTWGTEVAIDDAALTGSNAVDTTTSAAMTCAGTCAAGDTLYWRYQLDATGTTTAVATLHFTSWKMEYTSNVGD